MSLRASITLVFFVFFGEWVRAQDARLVFDRYIQRGDYTAALHVIDEGHWQNTGDSAYCLARYLTDVGARLIAIEIIEKALDYGQLSPQYRYDLLRIFLDATYEESLEEDYHKVLFRLDNLIAEHFEDDAGKQALKHASWSRYYARNMEHYLAAKHGMHAIRLMQKSELDTLDKEWVWALALNSFRNTSLYTDEDDEALTLTKNRGALSSDLAKTILRRQSTKSFFEARKLLVLGNVLQDIGHTAYKPYPLTQEVYVDYLDAHQTAVKCYKQILSITDSTIGRNNWITSYATALLALQASYREKYDLYREYVIDALARATPQGDTALILNRHEQNNAVKVLSWSTRLFGLVSRDSLSFYQQFNGKFNDLSNYYKLNQLRQFTILNKWLKDGYRTNTGQDYFPFVEYFKGTIFARDDLSASLSFYEFAGAKFTLIERIMNARFDEAAKLLLDEETSAIKRAEFRMLERQGKLPVDLLMPDHVLCKSEDCDQLRAFLSGAFNPTVHQIQKALGTKEAYIEFLEFRAELGFQSVMIVLHDTTFQVNFSFSSHFECFYETNEWQDDHLGSSYILEGVSRNLWWPIDSVLSQFKIEALNIKPSRSVSDVPFEALVDKEGSSIINEYKVRYSLDLGIENLLEQINRSNVQNFAAFQPNYSTSPLPYSYKLTNALGQRYGTLLSSTIGLSELKAALQAFKVIHIGAHGSTQKPISDLPFSGLSRHFADSTFIYLENEKVSLNELNDLESNADLVVLAACESGRGIVQYGEGKLDFTRVMMQAGVKAVIIGLWKLDDYATAKILSHFYENLEQDMYCSEALRQAKLQFLAEETDPEYQHPKYWAGIIYVGQDQKIDLSKASYAWVWWVLIAAGVVLMLLLVWVKRSSFNIFSW